MRRLVTACLLILFAQAACAQDAASKLTAIPILVMPEWIWQTGDRKAGQETTLSTEFELGARIVHAKLKLAADYCAVKLLINGRPVAAIDAYGPWLELDVTNHIRSGKNQLRLEAKSIEGPAQSR